MHFFACGCPVVSAPLNFPHGVASAPGEVSLGHTCVGLCLGAWCRPVGVRVSPFTGSVLVVARLHLQQTGFSHFTLHFQNCRSYSTLPSHTGFRMSLSRSQKNHLVILIGIVLNLAVILWRMGVFVMLSPSVPAHSVCVSIY